MFSPFCRQRLLALGLVLLGSSVPVHAGLLADLSRALGLLPVLTAVSDTTGLALDETVLALDASLSGGSVSMAPLAPVGLGMSERERSQLAAMDAPASQALVAGPLAEGGDQPALGEVEYRDPRYEVAYAQTGPLDCRDGDGDGVCDRDDQCRSTPPSRRVMANGCHLESASPLRLDGVHFASGRWQLSPSAKAVLNLVVDVLREAPSGRIEIAGHTDSSGSEAYNLRLSERRAGAVRDYLISKGVSGERLRARGYGEAQPVSSAEPARNRRVELRLQAE